jgi:hypothetical protein
MLATVKSSIMQSIVDFPMEIIFNILKDVPYDDLKFVFGLNKHLRCICQCNDFWKLKTENDFEDVVLEDKWIDWKKIYEQRYKEAQFELVKGIEDGDIEDVKYLLRIGINPNFKLDLFGTPLIIALERGQENMIRLLLNERADLNLQDNQGHTAYTYAIKRHEADIARLILEDIQKNYITL